jgi:hypothetical protein
MKRNCFVAVDFDGTCVTHEYPDTGADVGADVWLRGAVALGAKLILLTMRDGQELDRAINWFDGHRIELWAINENPEQAGWTTSPMIFYHTLIDARAIGSPLTSRGPREREFIDWEVAGPKLMKKVAGILNQ